MEKRLDDVTISRAITESFFQQFLSCLKADVVIAGAGPSGLICAYYLARAGLKVNVLERQLRVGGGMPGGGMMFNRITVQEEAKPIFEELDISLAVYQEGLYVADALETVSTLCSRTIRAGAMIFNLISVEDVMMQQERVCGVVINWSATVWSKLHVDPLSMAAKVVVDATGHDAEICRIVERKTGPRLRTPSGTVVGEKSMWAQVGEQSLVENTREVFPGLLVCGMAANAVMGAPRMGAIFGGMFLSGRKAAELILSQLKPGEK
ncbi:MAG TPA: sulfide-dependent adenosine diphosphate thiazole synthase [bacterium]|nr:sulfide-dependent adenosine diphosphate thiazole synthase [bacterium]HOL67280.1 sulfide-dependent adenosine diphosphate thiazole synthase [bacterium]HPP11145.1 sulfide-dependent adenosine diphosphate thiazole synthase [bacterium]